MITLKVYPESWPIRGSFAISRGAKTQADVVVVELHDGNFIGRGECVPYARYGESSDAVINTITDLNNAIVNGLDRDHLQTVLPAGAARNALDCAFWDLAAKRAGKRAWQLAGVEKLQPLTSVYTLSLDTPANMQSNARTNAHYPLLKLKLAGPDDLSRVKAVREGSPNATIIVDANEGWTADLYTELAPQLAALGVAMIEQPLPAGSDALLRDIQRPVPVCADESCHDSASLTQLQGKYDLINIKLDKTGGLSEALKLRYAAVQAGLGIMVGCMLATSLSMAPAMIVAQGAKVIDLDGPLLLNHDRTAGITYQNGVMSEPTAALWG